MIIILGLDSFSAALGSASSLSPDPPAASASFSALSEDGRGNDPDTFSISEKAGGESWGMGWISLFSLMLAVLVGASGDDGAGDSVGEGDGPCCCKAKSGWCSGSWVLPGCVLGAPLVSGEGELGTGSETAGGGLEDDMVGSGLGLEPGRARRSVEMVWDKCQFGMGDGLGGDGDGDGLRPGLDRAVAS